ncbi:MAG: hypothetical protein KM310_00115 [Clostridiales bacterium]|nr:hypothetical protein [Clostridiales bacterium]
MFFQLAEIYQERDPRRLLLKILQAVKDKEKSEAEKPAQEEPDIRRKVLSRALRFGSET